MGVRTSRATLVGHFSAACEAHADRRAVVAGEESWTYGELAGMVAARRRELAEAGIGRGSRVAFLLGANLEWVATFYALLGMGAIVVPINTTWVGRELGEGLRLSDAEFVVVQSEFKGRDLFALLEGAAPDLAGATAGALRLESLPFLKGVIHQDSDPDIATPGYAVRVAPVRSGAVAQRTDDPGPEPVAPEDHAMYLLTSGSTRFPKPVVHTHRSLEFAFSSLADAGQVAPEDTWLLTGTTYHVSAYLGLVLPHIRGACTVLMEYFKAPEAMELIERHRINTAWGFDTHFTSMHRDPDFARRDLSSLKKIWLGSNPATFDEIRKLGAEWHGNIYADSECAACGSFFPYDRRDDLHRMKFSHGVPVPGTDVLIIDPDTGEELPAGERGEICVTGPQLFEGYYNMPEETARAFLRPGVHRTGDLGWKDEDGFVYYIGRYKEMLKSGGENVSIAEVEQTLAMTIDDIEKVVVVGVPDEKWGERIVALTELSGGSSATDAALRARAKEELAGYKVPKEFLFVGQDDWVITPTGKIDRSALRRLAMSRLGVDEDGR